MPLPTILRLNALLWAALCLGLLIAPAAFCAFFALEPTLGAEVMARRSGAIFLGLVPLYLTLSRAEAPLHQPLARAGLLMMLALAILGLLEWAAGRVGPGILGPVAIEILFSALYLPHALRPA